jgi:ABC-type Zn uptake system ZnuABC Zn-binding protein ZnuA
LGSLIRDVGGGEVQVTVFCKGPEDPHYVVAKPSFIKQLSVADLFVQVGADLEVGYAPVLIEGCRNVRVRPGTDGFLDVSESIPLLEIPGGPVDRSMGDVHAGGNPHYLLDPANGLRAAETIANRLAKLRPEQATAFHDRLKAFRLKLGSALVGPDLAAKLSPLEVSEAARKGKLAELLTAKGLNGELGGWMADLKPYEGAALAGDHNLYVYFLHRFGLRMDVYLEPKPGISPTTSHLRAMLKRVADEKVRLLLVSPYFSEKPVDFFVQHAGLPVARMAHQAESMPDAPDYVAMCAHNVRALLTALQSVK